MIYIVDHVDLNVSSSGSFILMNVHLASLLNMHLLVVELLADMCLNDYLVLIQASSVPEVLRPLYESPKILAQKMTAAVCRCSISLLLSSCWALVVLLNL